MALVCGVQIFCCSAAFNDRVNLRGHLGWLCPFAQASLDNSCYWDEGGLKSRVVKEECKKCFQCGWEQAASFPWHLLEAMVSQFSHFFECSLIYFILWSPWQCLGRGVQLLVGLSFEHEGWQNPSFSCLLLCTSDAQSAPTAVSIPNKNQLPVMLCCKGRSLPRDTVEGEAENMMSCSWLSFPQRKKVQGKDSAPSQGFHKIPSTFGEGKGCEYYNPQMSWHNVRFQIIMTGVVPEVIRNLWRWRRIGLKEWYLMRQNVLKEKDFQCWLVKSACDLGWQRNTRFKY